MTEAVENRSPWAEEEPHWLISVWVDCSSIQANSRQCTATSNAARHIDMTSHATSHDGRRSVDATDGPIIWPSLKQRENSSFS